MILLEIVGDAIDGTIFLRLRVKNFSWYLLSVRIWNLHVFLLLTTFELRTLWK